MEAPQTIFKLHDDSQFAFSAAPEILSGIQFGQLERGDDDKTPIMVVNGQVGLSAGPELRLKLQHFYEMTWKSFRSGAGTPDIIKLYDEWLGSLDTIMGVTPHHISTEDMCAFASTLHHYAASPPPVPPPPPTRPNVLQGGFRPPGTSNVAGHLPFQDTTTSLDIFYRFEAWPSSNRVGVGSPGTIKSSTYANPSSELSFLPTGFAAVARNALPSFFPAVFRYELAPVSGTPILCGAVVPMFGQSGGGVEVMFSHAQSVMNRGAIANPAVVHPF